MTGGPFVRNLLGLGCQLVFYLEYTPIREGTEDWVITGEQRAGISDIMEGYRRTYPALFVAVPGDEDRCSGCLAGGRGFVHISADGNLEACPFAPFSDTNLRDASLKEALQSELLRAIRRHSEELEEAKGGCALWDQKERVYAPLAQ